MKKLISVFSVFCTVFILKAQEIKLVKDSLVCGLSTDSMYYMDYQKIIPFKDSGIVQVGYADSVSPGKNPAWRLRVCAFDKNFKALWSLRLSFNNIIANISACTDNNNNIYVTYFAGSFFNLLKISPTGQIIFDKPIENQVSSNVIVFNRIAWYNGALAILGNIYINQTSFAPVITIFNADGTLRRKHTFPVSSSTNSGGLYSCSNLAITRENNLAFTFQLDANSNYKVVCYDSLLKEIWNKTINITLGFNNNLFSQGGQVTFINFDNQTPKVAFFKYDSKTGAGGTKTENTYLFSSVFNLFTLPTNNGNYLTFGNYLTSGGFDNAIDYFDNDQVLASVMSNSVGCRNRTSDACYIGNTLYTIAIRFADQYCDNSKGIYRGCLWLKKFNTDFLTQQMSVKDVVKTGNEMTAYPNPFTSVLNLRSETENMAITAINETGVSLKLPFSFSNGSTTIDTKTLAPGIYLLHVLNIDNGQIKSMKVVKE